MKKTTTDELFRTATNFLTGNKPFAYFSISLVLFTFISAIFVNFPGTADYWEHLAAIFSFSRNLFHPDNPYVLSTNPSHLLSPYHFFWGFIANIFNVHPIYLFPLIGAINIGLFLLALMRLSRFLTSSKKFALLFALTFLFFWNNPWHWSGFYNFGLLPLTSVYPYWFSFSLSLIILSEYGNSEKIALQILLILLAAVAYVSHPVTGSFLLLATAVKILSQNSFSFKRKILLLFGLLLVFPISILWPFFPILGAIGKSRDFAAMSFSGNYRLFYRSVIEKIFPALLGLPLIFLVIKKEAKAKFVAISFTAFFFIYLFNYFFLHNSVFGRYIVYLVFFLHVWIVLFLKSVRSNLIGKLSLLIFSLCLFIFAAQEIKNSTQWLGVSDDLKNHTTLGTHSNFSLLRRYQKLKRFIKTSDVAFAPLHESWLLPAMIGCKVVGVKHSNPFMPDYYDRLKDNETFFSDSISFKEQCRLLNKYRVKYVLLPANASTLNNADAFVEIFKDENFRIFQVHNPN